MNSKIRKNNTKIDKNLIENIEINNKIWQY